MVVKKNSNIFHMHIPTCNYKQQKMQLNKGNDVFHVEFEFDTPENIFSAFLKCEFDMRIYLKDVSSNKPFVYPITIHCHIHSDSKATKIVSSSKRLKQRYDNLPKWVKRMPNRAGKVIMLL